MSTVAPVTDTDAAALLVVETAAATERRRRSRWALGAYQRKEGNSVRLGARRCMTALEQGAAGVQVAYGEDGTDRIGGVFRCSSLSCQICGPVIRSRRSVEIDAILTAAFEAGDRVLFVTATLSHKLGDELHDVGRVLTTAWRKALGGRKLRQAGYIGCVRAVEVTCGCNGWHPHIHAAFVFEASRTVGACVLAAKAVGTKYRQSVADAGGFVNRRGFDVQVCRSVHDVARYLADIADDPTLDPTGWSLGAELSRMDLKAAHRVGATPTDLLVGAASGLKREAKLWRIYETWAMGRHLIRVAPALSKRYAVKLQSDEEAAAGEAIVDPRAVLTFFAVAWRKWLEAGIALDAVYHGRQLVLTGESPPAWWWAGLMFSDRRNTGPPVAA